VNIVIDLILIGFIIFGFVFLKIREQKKKTDSGRLDKEPSGKEKEVMK